LTDSLNEPEKLASGKYSQQMLRSRLIFNWLYTTSCSRTIVKYQPNYYL